MSKCVNNDQLFLISSDNNLKLLNNDSPKICNSSTEE